MRGRGTTEEERRKLCAREARIAELERQARQRLERARMAAAKVPRPVAPATVERLAALAALAGTLLAVVPVMILFFILQREFISGLTAGAVKG